MLGGLEYDAKRESTILTFRRKKNIRCGFFGVTLRVMSLHFVLSLRTAVLSGSLELLDESGGSLDESTRFSFLSCADLGQMKIWWKEMILCCCDRSIPPHPSRYVLRLRTKCKDTTLTGDSIGTVRRLEWSAMGNDFVLGFCLGSSGLRFWPSAGLRPSAYACRPRAKTSDPSYLGKNLALGRSIADHSRRWTVPGVSTLPTSTEF